MVFVGFLEILSFLLGFVIFYREVFSLKFKNYVPAVFILLYFPLFCVTPIMYHFIIGGAITINPGYENLIFKNPNIYAVYHLYNITFLLCFIIISKYLKKNNQIINSFSVELSKIQNIFLFIFLFIGVSLYVYSTGLSISELLIADRFSWFLNSNYSSFNSVVASYFISLSPLVVY